MHSRNPLFYLILTAGFWLSSTSTSLAITVAPGDLNPGESYRLAFVTNSGRNATSSSIADYNDFITLAASSVTELDALGTNWSAIASTPTVDARDNTGTDPVNTGVPIYLLDGTRIADDNQSLWNGSIDFALNITESGATADSFVWTGTSTAGISHGSALALGGTSTNLGVGLSGSNMGSWIDAGASSPGSLHRLYALSDELTIPQTPVPIPPAVFLFGSGLVGLFGVAKRHAN